MVTRGVDPVQLEDDRKHVMEQGYDRDGKDALRGMAYVAFQELATRISHRNTGRYSDDPVADRIMARISADENLHMVFYRDILAEAMKLDPSAAVLAIADEVIAFEMPGAGMENFTRKAAQMAKAGIYDLRIHHDEVVWPRLRHWGVFEAEHLSPAAEMRREELRQFLVKLDAQASRFEARRAQTADREAARAVFARLREALSSGGVRAAEPDGRSPIGWRVNAWVKRGILLGFKFGDIADVSMDHGKLPFYDKDTLPLKKPGLAAGVRIVPGGSAVRDGAYIGRGVICMPRPSGSGPSAPASVPTISGSGSRPCGRCAD